ncbi:hypothetical protein TWF281_004219 [Arthrobotrys megalospora]
MFERPGTVEFRACVEGPDKNEKLWQDGRSTPEIVTTPSEESAPTKDEDADNPLDEGEPTEEAGGVDCGDQDNNNEETEVEEGLDD